MSANVDRWNSQGRPIPAPHDFKVEMILEMSRRFRINVFVETGSHVGSTIERVRDAFREIHSIELSVELHRRCVDRFRGDSHINLYQGCSEDVLPGIITKISEPILFWLDAHYSADGTAKGSTSSSLYKEIPAILSHPIDRHVILVDDTYDCFDADGYMSPDSITKAILNKYPSYKTDIDGYVFRALPS